eukprot:13999590-Ditylum_brightwellii.AAC.1
MSLGPHHHQHVPYFGASPQICKCLANLGIASQKYSYQYFFTLFISTTPRSSRSVAVLNAFGKVLYLIANVRLALFIIAQHLLPRVKKA